MDKFKTIYYGWVKRWGKVPVALTLTLVMLLTVFAAAMAAEYVLTTTPGEDEYNIGDALFQIFLPTDATGTGTFNPFVRVKSNKEIVQGYNTDLKEVQFDEDFGWTDSIPLSDVPYYMVDGILYREFQLDINQVGSKPLISLDEVQIWLGGPDVKTISGFVPETIPTDFGSFTGYTLQEVYNLDGYPEGAPEDNYLILNYSYNDGSGKRDMKLLVPDSKFEPYDEACQFMGTGCEQYVVFYTKFGINDPTIDH